MAAVTIMGDSNIKHIYVKDFFDAALKTDTTFIQTNTKEALSIAVNKAPKKGKRLVFHCSWLNEISTRCKGLDDKEEERKKEVSICIEKMVSALTEAANKKEDWLFVIMKPIRRKDPEWIDQNLDAINVFIAETFDNSQNNGNVRLIEAPDYGDTHFNVDGIHLNTRGKAILQSHIVDAITKHMMEIDVETSMEVEKTEDKTPGTSKKANLRSSQKTKQSGMQTRGKRQRSNQDSEASEDESMVKKPNLDLQAFEAIMNNSMSRMEAMVDKVTKQNEQNTKDIEELRQHNSVEFKKIDLTLARIKEDTDSSENERMKDTIIIKKLNGDTVIPTSISEITSMMKKVAGEMVANIMQTDSDNILRYIGSAYPIDNKGKRNSDKELPPIKIQFKRKDDCVDFRFKAIEQSKKYNAKYTGVYVVHPQNPGTRVRVQIMWGLAKKIKNDKEKVESWVNQSNPKPTLVVKKKGQQKIYSFVQAVTMFGSLLNSDDLAQANQLANRFFKGEVGKLFIILSDEEN